AGHPAGADSEFAGRSDRRGDRRRGHRPDHARGGGTACRHFQRPRPARRDTPVDGKTSSPGGAARWSCRRSHRRGGAYSMMARALAAKVGRIERKISIRWMWEVALFAWSAEQRTLLFAVMAQRPDWIASWPEARHAWPCRALERDPHIFPDRVLM